MNIEKTQQQAVALHQAGQLLEASELYRSVLEACPNHPEANHNMGALAVQMQQPAAGLPYFMAALDADPARAQYWLSYIDALFQAGQPEDARQVLDLARQQGLEGEEVEAMALRLEGDVLIAELLNTDNHHTSNVSPPVPKNNAKKPKTKSAKPDKSARRPAPHKGKNPSQHDINTLVALFNEGRYTEAAILAQMMTVHFPLHNFGWKVLGTVFSQMGRSTDALPLLQKSAALSPNDVEAHYNLGNTLRGLGRLGEAEASYRRALQIKPDLAEAHSNLGLTLQELGRLDESEVSLRRALQIKPDFADAYNNLGVTLHDMGRLDEAEASYRQALQFKPDFADAHYNLGVTLHDLGRLDEAEASYRQALQIKPDFADAYNNLGVTLHDLGRLDEAEASCRRALQIKPDFAYAHNNLGFTLIAKGRLSEAEASCQRALQIKPDLAEAHSNLGLTFQELGRLAEAVTCYRRALEINPDYVMALDNLLFVLNYHPDKSREEIFAVCGEYDKHFGLPLRGEWRAHSNSREALRRLRIGYVSPDFRRHAVAYFAEPILANHDKSQVEIFCYAEVKREDEYTDRFRHFADHWHSTVGLNDDAAAQLIRDHQIDILVDLAGHTRGNRLLVFARKPAPIQLTYLGYPSTTGLSAMDYRITDRHADPEGVADAYYTEHLLRLPDSLCCYRPAADMPEPSPLPALSRGYLTFGSFNNANKIDQHTLALWAALLRSLPTARLMMLTVPEGESRLRMMRRFTELGIDAQRLEFHGKLPATEFHRKFLEVDIALDPVSVSGGTTTCESLWMGVPVIAWIDERFITRVSYSFLSTAGLANFAAFSAEDYIRIAVHLADNLPLLVEIRAGLRGHLATSPLIDEVGFTHNLENLYRGIWEKWCSAT